MPPVTLATPIFGAPRMPRQPMPVKGTSTAIASRRVENPVTKEAVRKAPAAPRVSQVGDEGAVGEREPAAPKPRPQGTEAGEDRAPAGPTGTKGKDAGSKDVTRTYLAPDAFGGIGLFAAEDIATGESVLICSAVIESPATIVGMYRRFKCMTDNEKKFITGVSPDGFCIAPAEEGEVRGWCSDDELRPFAHFVCVMRTKSFSKSVQEDAFALYPDAMYANHSCEPNVSYRSIGGRLCYIALRPVKKGEEITMTYIEGLFAGTVYRREVIQRRYGFTCGCPRCASAADGSRQLTCPHCKAMRAAQALRNGNASDSQDEGVHDVASSIFNVFPKASAQGSGDLEMVSKAYAELTGSPVSGGQSVSDDDHQIDIGHWSSGGGVWTDQ
eukprot:GHVU01167905.1.p1 GENE.GHVU01167905.1~~GHVU01167905.1.p1  ORF type:complete len:385 (+),score=43.35 GHVU01167905.1:221-1375(+)